MYHPNAVVNTSLTLLVVKASLTFTYPLIV
jgi:hypothetical protein